MDLLAIAQIAEQFKSFAEIPPNLKVVMAQALTGPVCQGSIISYQNFPKNIDFLNDPDVKTALRVGYNKSAEGQNLETIFVIGFDANNRPVKAVMYAGDQSMKTSGQASAHFLEVMGVNADTIMKMQENVRGSNSQGVLQASQCRSLDNSPVVSAIRQALSVSP